MIREYAITFDGEWWTVSSRHVHGKYSIRVGELETIVVGTARSSVAAIAILADWITGHEDD